MSVIALQELKQRLPPGRGLLGLDVGEKTVGIAICDPGLTIASPVETIRRTKFRPDAEALRRIVENRRAGGLVVGLPINMDGTEGPRAQSVRQFVTNLLQLMDLPVAFWDERLSTVAVTRRLIEADVSRAKRAKVVDQMAAAYILQGALDALSRVPAA